MYSKIIFKTSNNGIYNNRKQINTDENNNNRPPLSCFYQLGVPFCSVESKEPSVQRLRPVKRYFPFSSILLVGNIRTYIFLKQLLLVFKCYVALRQSHGILSQAGLLLVLLWISTTGECRLLQWIMELLRPEHVPNIKHTHKRKTCPRSQEKHFPSPQMWNYMREI